MALRPSFAICAVSISGLALWAVAACSSGGGSSSFVIRTADESVSASTQVAIGGRNLAFLAEEATTGAGGTDFNNDGDKIDAIAVALEMNSQTEYVLNVATDRLAWIGNELYLVVDEAKDEVDWNTDLDTTDLVLLHWNKATPLVLDFVDEVSGSGLEMVAIGTNLFYTSSTTPAGALASNVNIISSSTPLVITPIPTQDLVAELSPEIVFEDEGLIFLSLDETNEGRDLNGDADSTDTDVLALLDGSISVGVIRNVELAVDDDSGPFRAKKVGTSDWQVGFLVSETDQDATNFNLPGTFSASWQPPQCIGFADGDTTDAILFFLEFADWNTNPGTSPARNTGLVGEDKIAIANGFIATISNESSEGTCDLNGDGDTSDDLVRFTQIVADPAPILPLNTAANIRALFDVPGGTHGLAELDNRFVIVVSEADDNFDINLGGETMNLIGWLSPSLVATAWDFTHSSVGTTFAGTTWMAEQPDRTRLDVALEERVNSVNINSHTPAVPGEDLDTNDSVPTFADFTGGSTLSFPGVAIAADSDNAGIVVARGYGFYRVSEAEDSRDWNSDGDESDFVLWRTSLTQGTSVYMGLHNSLVRPALHVNGNETSPAGGAYIALESQQGTGLDLNGDGDTNDLVLRYFQF